MTSAIIATLAVAGAAPTSALGTVAVKGSDTMLILNQRWAEAFGKKHSAIAIEVTGGGSSIGINAFINGVADVCASSRPMRKSEVDKARSRGAITNEIPVALDGLAVVVHSSNPVSSLTMDQVRRIYIGQINNWSQVGGPNQAIVVLSRDSNSGTYGFFQEKVLKNQNWGRGVRFMPSTAEEARETARTPGAVAYGGVAYFKGREGLKILPIAPAEGKPAILPTEANVRNKSYPIWRYLYYYTNGSPKGDTKTFIDWCLSGEGQAVVEQVGYYSLR
jgi:phosphate transport system substrate-binding protein